MISGRHLSDARQILLTGAAARRTAGFAPAARTRHPPPGPQNGNGGHGSDKGLGEWEKPGTEEVEVHHQHRRAAAAGEIAAEESQQTGECGATQGKSPRRGRSAPEVAPQGDGGEGEGNTVGIPKPEAAR